MSEIRIDAGKAERIIAQILLDLKSLAPTDATVLAAIICERLTAAMPTRTSLDLYRIIPREPPDGDSFASAVAKKLFEGKVSSGDAAEIWELVYDQGRHLRVN